MAPLPADPMASLPPLPPTEDGRAVYDRIMGSIEPELLSANLPHLTEKYKNETPEQQEARATRFAKAFQEYEKQYAAYRATQDTQQQTFRRGARQLVETKASAPDQQALQTLESSINAQ